MLWGHWLEWKWTVLTIEFVFTLQAEELPTPWSQYCLQDDSSGVCRKYVSWQPRDLPTHHLEPDTISLVSCLSHLL